MDAVLLVQSLFAPVDADQDLRALFTEDVSLRVWRWDGSIAVRGRQRVLDWLREERCGWPDASLQAFPSPESQPSAVQFRIQATEAGRYVEHNRALFLAYKGSLVQGIDVYCSEPVFSAHRKDYIAPSTMSYDEVKVFLEEIWHGLDVREWMPLNRWRHESLRITHAGSDDAHPGSNFVGGSRWTADEADERIRELLEEHRRKGAGFTWWVMPFDTPADLCERLERHGLMLAGQNVRMARLGLEDLSDIAVNERLVIEEVDGYSDDDIEKLLYIDAASFHLTPEQVDNFRTSLRERLRAQGSRERELWCLAYLGGRPVGMAAARFQYGITYLAGASTLPEYRGQRVYSSLLKRRLQAAHDRGYHLASIDAGPMSKRVVQKYGFREFGTINVYGWMPHMDMAVIRSLVPDE